VHLLGTMTEENPQSQLVEDLQSLRDELSLQLHLASMQAKTKYEELQNRLELFEERVSQRHPEQELKEAFQKLKQAFQKLRDSWPSS